MGVRNSNDLFHFDEHTQTAQNFIRRPHALCFNRNSPCKFSHFNSRRTSRPSQWITTPEFASRFPRCSPADNQLSIYLIYSTAHGIVCYVLKWRHRSNLDPKNEFNPQHMRARFAYPFVRDLSTLKRYMKGTPSVPERCSEITRPVEV
jgi:hypothetical protein